MNQEKPPLDPHPLSEYVAWAGNRNREPLLGVLKEKLPKDPARVLELASGSGMHINYFAPHFDHLHFHPSDKDEEVFDNIKQLRQEQGNDNIADPMHLDLTNPDTWINRKRDLNPIYLFRPAIVNLFLVDMPWQQLFDLFQGLRPGQFFKNMT